jgi:hypothetical protein
MPTARETALATAEATGNNPPSPIPFEAKGPGPLPFSIKMVSSSSGINGLAGDFFEAIDPMHIATGYRKGLLGFHALGERITGHGERGSSQPAPLLFADLRTVFSGN